MADSDERSDSPLFEAKRYDEPSVFTPESLVREARRQKDLPEQSVPDICVLGPRWTSTSGSSRTPTKF
jgi:hypothetical protein